jgi:hypothetical protein
MSKRVVVAVALAFVAAGQARATDRPECANRAAVPNAAVNCPDRFAWEKFVEVMTPTGGAGVRGAGVPAFQSFASDPETFPCPPADLTTCRANPGAKGCPTWPSDYQGEPQQVTQRSARLALSGVPPVPAHTVVGFDCWNVANTELVYRNRPTFDYILANGLWYVEGIQERFEEGFVYDFPTTSVEVKTNWVPLTAEQAASGRYYTMTQDGQTLGLIAMHISTKDLPNWFWSTFEHVDNPGRCDFLGCHDSFGYTPHDVPARPRELCLAYPPEAITPQLAKLIGGLAPAARHYRLKGTMVDFTTATGSPNLVGNSITEAGFVPTASCMTCHARATVQATPGPPNGLSPYPGIAGFTPEGQSYNGTPDPSWFYAGNDPVRRWSVQTDFVWAIPFRASSLAATAACCSSGGPCQCTPVPGGGACRCGQGSCSD